MTACALVGLCVSTPAFADSLSAEVKFFDVGPSDAASANEFKLKYSHDVTNTFFATGEVKFKQETASNNVKGTLVAGGGAKLPTVAGFKPKVYAEFGQVFAGNNYNFWGAGANVSRHVYGPFSAEVGYRHREGLNTNNLKQDRLSAGVKVKLTDDWSSGLSYYRYTGSSRKDAIGISVSRKL